ncbi:MAG: hypothetical protein ACOYOK_12485 [Pseudobdellovibrionaceae bacterium]
MIKVVLYRWIFVALIVLVTSVSSAYESKLKTFLQMAGYGTLAGAGLGVVSLAFKDRPSENINNIARGASLGLYAGMIYGLVLANKPEEKNDLVFWPQILHQPGSASPTGYGVVGQYSF